MAIDVEHMPLSQLTSEALNVLNRLNAKRLFPTNGPERLSRDYRGLAGLVGISMQDAENLNISMVLGTWLQRDPLHAVVHQLLRRLETIDRFDIRDDLNDLARQGRLVRGAGPANVMQQRMPPAMDDRLTDDDMLEDRLVKYDVAWVFVAQDKPFVKAVSGVLTNLGFRLFDKDSLRLGVMEVDAMAKLMTMRCRYTIIVVSSAFTPSHANRDEQFYTKHVQAHTVSRHTHQLIICELDDCDVPDVLEHYTKLKVRNNQTFWRKLFIQLNYRREPELPIPNWVRSGGILPANNLASSELTTRGLAEIAAHNTYEASSSAHDQFRLPFNHHASHQSFIQPPSSTHLPDAFVPNAPGSFYNVPNWAVINGHATNDSISSSGSASTVSSSYAINNGIRILGDYGVTNGSIVDGRSTTAPTPTVRIGAAAAPVPNASVGSSPDNNQHINMAYLNSQQVTDESASSSQAASGSVEMSSGFVSSIQGANSSPVFNGSVTSDQSSSSLFDSPNVQLPNGSSANVEANRFNGEDTEGRLNRVLNEIRNSGMRTIVRWLRIPTRSMTDMPPQRQPRTVIAANTE